MNSIEINNLSLNFGDVKVLKDLNLSVNKGEFLVLLGASGCGKSTLLNCIAGLLEINDGQIYINNQNVTWFEPSERGIGMVFQSYALYPQMSVKGNLSFSLKNAKLSKEEIEERVKNASEILQIEDLLERKPAALSGGQRQRVAIGRALVRDVEVFLFDEPLSNLDANLRVQMRTEIKRLHQKLNASIVYVTHDQIEAMTLATKIVVLKDGLIQQIGAPSEIYNYPANLFVADFMGSPSMNLVNAKVIKTARGMNIKVNKNGVETTIFMENRNLNLPENVVFGVRPENIYEDNSKAVKNGSSSSFQIDVVEPAGSDTYVVTSLGGVEVTARFNAETKVEPGDWVNFIIDISKVSYFDPETGSRLN